MAISIPCQWISVALLLLLMVAAGALPPEDESGPGLVAAPPTALPFCQQNLPHASSRERDGPSLPAVVKSVILVSTLDGRITALDSANGSRLWSHATGNGDLLSSTISNHEFTSQGKWVRLVPSLDGDLYTFDGENMGAALASVDALLSNSLKMSDDTVVTGGKEVLTYAIDLKTGQLRYSCGANKCQYFNTSTVVRDEGDDEDNEGDLLLLNLLTKTVRAVAARNGSEKWNYSVGQHEAKMAPPTLSQSGCHESKSNGQFQAMPDMMSHTVKFVPSEGVVLAFAEVDSFNPIWDHKFDTPIVHAWSMIGRDLQPLDLFENSYDAGEDPTTGHSELPRPILYIGTYNKQLYIIESRNVQNNIPLEYKSFGIDLTSAPPRVIWQPYLFTAQSRTPTILGRRPPSDLSLISHVGPEESTALVVSHNGIEYPFDNGFYLYPSRPLNINAILIDFNGEEVEPEPESIEQIIIISLWFWWKEVLAISVTFAVIVNVCITRHFILRMQKKFKKESSETVVVADSPSPPSASATDVEQRRESQTELRSQGSTDSTASMSTPPAEFVSRYQTDFEPVEILGKGGFGVVFHARNKIDDCDYAIKRICMPNRNECKERIMREVKALAKLDHVGIVRYYNSWLECPPPHWQEKIDRQWSSSGEGFLTPSASMTMDELHRAYGLRGLHQTKRATGGLASSVTSGRDGLNVASSSSAAATTDGDRCVLRHRKNAALSEPNSNWSDLPEGNSDSACDSQSSASDSLSSLAVTNHRRTTDLSNDSFIVFAASESQEADKKSSGGGYTSDATPGLTSSQATGVGLSPDEASETANRGQELPDVTSTSPRRTPPSLRAPPTVLSPFVWPKPDRLYLYIQMQLCRKDSLKDWLSANTDCRNKLEMLDFFDQIMSAVEYVHVQGLMHRDLKPSNIFFALDGTIKVGDFGLVAATMTPMAAGAGQSGEAAPHAPSTGAGSTPPAVVASRDVRHTNQVGTMLYMSPEQIAGENYDHKVDIYSMGLIFFEMLVPFMTAMERIKIMSDVRNLKFPANFVSEYSVEHSLVASMLTHVPRDRPSSSEVKRHPLFQDFQPRPELLRWSRRTRTTSRTFSTSSSGSGGIDVQGFQDGSGDSVYEQVVAASSVAGAGTVAADIISDPGGHQHCHRVEAQVATTDKCSSE